MPSQLDSKQPKRQAPKPGVPIKLNKSNVDAITEPGVYRDTELTGFLLRVGSGGIKSYRLIGKPKGKRNTAGLYNHWAAMATRGLLTVREKKRSAYASC